MTLASTIRSVCGVGDPDEDLRLTEEEFTALIDTYILAVQEWIETYTKRSFTTWPEGLDQIVIEIVCNIIQGQVLRQDTPILDEESVKVRGFVLGVVTDDIRFRLKPYVRRRIGLFGIGTRAQYDELMDTLDEDDIDDVV